ncbi:MAG: sodium:solute symporter family protein, partial [Planctomycetota bacterium]|nr:sodium:solute symporter family protein [Planctomycetota bacterium]
MIPFVYVYTVGGIVFSAGLFFACRNGYLNFTRRGITHLLTCLLVVGFFMTIQGYLQFAAMETAEPLQYQQPLSESASAGIRGTPLDYGIMIGYFLVILAVGTWFGRGQKTTRDFFFGGQRFSWWIIALSLVATTIGSYSFVKYSSKGFQFGLSSTQTYLNDWIWMPLLLFGWLPILYFSRINSIPEYFARRFNQRARFWATCLLLVYLIGYVGVNLFTMGKVLHELVGWSIPFAALLVAAISCTYVTAGGQTSVIMTDLFQGFMLLLTGVLILVLGMNHLGGFEGFWNHLPRDHRLAFSDFNQAKGFPSVGIFWQDGIANSAMFYFLNQGIIMRFLATKSVAESRKSGLAMIVVLMTVGACVVGGGGWLAAAMVHSGEISPETKPGEAFYVATEILSHPGVFGLILAALTAALMSTVDTLITAISAVVVNDVYKVYIRPEANDQHLLKTARITSVLVTFLGVLLVPLFMTFDSIYDAHGAFTAAATPPLVVALLLSVFWRRFTATAAVCTMVGGMIAIGLSMLFPVLVLPFSHGVPMGEEGDGFLGGMKQFKFMRACYGIVVCFGIGLLVSCFTRAESFEKQRGLVWGTIQDALKNFKGSPGSEGEVRKVRVPVHRIDSGEPVVGSDFPVVQVSRRLADSLSVASGDLVYVSDCRWWLGGLRSSQCRVGEVFAGEAGQAVVRLPAGLYERIVVAGRED